MGLKLIVGLDGAAAGERALAHAKRLARMAGGSDLVLVYVIEWSPYTFQSAEENAVRHRRREEEIALARTRILDPALQAAAGEEEFATRGLVRHGKVADILNRVAIEENADQIVVARSSGEGLAARVFGSATANLVMGASVPVTVVV